MAIVGMKLVPNSTSNFILPVEETFNSSARPTSMFETLKKLDWDDVLAYETFKTVRVRDRRLGLLNYIFLIAILIFIIYSIVSKQLYLTKEPVSGGAVRTTIQPPSSFSTPSYCTDAQCLYLAPTQLVPSQDSGSVFVTSRVTLTNASSIPSDCYRYEPSRVECMLNFTGDHHLYYVSNIEDYTIMIEHSVQGSKTAVSLRNGLMQGSLLSSDGKEKLKLYLPSNATDDDVTVANTKAAPENVIKRATTVPGDIMKVSDILIAAGSPDLQAASHSPGAKTGETLRSSGLQVIVFIEYMNKESEPGKLKYEYKANVIDGSEAKLLENKQIAGSGNTIIIQEWNRHGVQIKFVQTGTLGQFEVMNVLSNIAGAFTLLGVAKVIVELLMLWILPQKKIYHEYKYQVTDDFSTLRKRKINPKNQSEANLTDETPVVRP